MTRYYYMDRPLGSCRAGVPARAADTGITVSNMRALYERPRLIHAGPAPWRRGEDEGADPFPWSWTRMDLAAGDRRTVLDRFSLWLTRSNGSVEVSMRICPITYPENGAGVDDPAQAPTIFSADFKVELLQHVHGSMTPVVIASSTTTYPALAAYPATDRPIYPILTQLLMGWRPKDGVGYLPDDHQIRAGLRIGQLYRPDMALLQRVKVRLDYGEPWDGGFAAARINPFLVRVSCHLTPGSTIKWDPAIINGYNTPEFLRLYCIATEVRDAGRIIE